MSKKDGRLFLVSWDQQGIEAVIDVTEKQEEFLNKERTNMWEILKGNKPTETTFESWLNQTAFTLEIRARANSHRHYEIYSFRTDYEMSDEDVRYLFDENPQGMADLVRERGNRIYSDRIVPEQLKII